MFDGTRALGTAISGDVPEACVWSLAQGGGSQSCVLASGRIWGRKGRLS